MSLHFWISCQRIPEPEVMDGEDEVEAYSSSAAQGHLDRLDQTFVEQALSLGVSRGDALDIGTGPGFIPIKLATQTAGLRLTGVDLSAAMLQRARTAARQAGVADRVCFRKGDAQALPFPARSFDLVLCNSLLHHSPDPVTLLNEISRVSKPGGAVLLRDLQRPSCLEFPLHALWFGRHYSGLMKKLYLASLRAAYTRGELEDLVLRSDLSGAHVFRKGQTHIGIQRTRIG